MSMTGVFKICSMLIFSFDLMFTHKLKILLQIRDARNIGFQGFTEMHVFEEKEHNFFLFRS